MRDLEEAEHAQQRARLASNSSSSRPTPEGSRYATPPSSADATAHPDEVAMAMAMGASAAAGGDADGDGAAGVGAAGDGEIDAALMDELVRLKMQLLMTGGGDDDALLALEDADDDDVDADADAPRVRGIGGGAASAAGGGAGRYDEGEDLDAAADVAGGSEVLRLDGSSDGDGDRYETYDGDAFDVSSRPTSRQRPPSSREPSRPTSSQEVTPDPTPTTTPAAPPGKAPPSTLVPPPRSDVLRGAEELLAARAPHPPPMGQRSPLRGIGRYANPPRRPPRSDLRLP